MKLYQILVWVLNATELLSCIVAFCYYGKLRGTKWRLLPFYLFAIFSFEMLGRYLGEEPSLRQYNPLLFNYVSFPIQFFFFFRVFFYDQYFTGVKKYVLSAATIYVLAVVADMVYFYDQLYFFHSFSYSVGNIMLLLLLMKYFYSLSTSRDILQFSYSMMFWFCLGVFIYYIGTLPLWALRNVLAFNHRNLFLQYACAGLVMASVMYLIFIIGIIRCRLK